MLVGEGHCDRRARDIAAVDEHPAERRACAALLFEHALEVGRVEEPGVDQEPAERHAVGIVLAICFPELPSASPTRCG